MGSTEGISALSADTAGQSTNKCIISSPAITGVATFTVSSVSVANSTGEINTGGAKISTSSGIESYKTLDAISPNWIACYVLMSNRAVDADSGGVLTSQTNRSDTL